MDPDLLAEYAMGPDYNVDPENLALRVDVKVAGPDFSIEDRGIRLNWRGDTHHRAQKDSDFPIDKYAYDAYVRDKKLSFSMHTWDAEGKHLDIFYFKDVALDETRKEDVSVNKDGAQLDLKVTLRFYNGK